jgi:hypothetical protein
MVILIFAKMTSAAGAKEEGGGRRRETELPEGASSETPSAGSRWSRRGTGGICLVGGQVYISFQNIEKELLTSC